MEIVYKPSFIKQLNGLEVSLQKEVLSKIDEFKNPSNHRQLRVHALKGKLKGYYSLSINYQYRVVFVWIGKGKRTAGMISVGDHDIYK